MDDASSWRSSSLQTERDVAQSNKYLSHCTFSKSEKKPGAASSMAKNAELEVERIFFVIAKGHDLKIICFSCI